MQGSVALSKLVAYYGPLLSPDNPYRSRWHPLSATYWRDGKLGGSDHRNHHQYPALSKNNLVITSFIWIK